jgi:hypothetical protein
MRGMAVVLASTIAVVVLASACTDEEILLATVPPGPPGGPPTEGRRCIDNTGCPTRAFCARLDCNEVGGVCEARSVICDEAPAPVCGCDGITYWNDCLRRAAGVTAATRGECTASAVICGAGARPPGGPGPGPGPGDPPPDPNVGCPTGALCARLLPAPAPLPPSPTEPPPPMESCPPEIPGTCWALPAICPANGGSDRWIVCGGPNTSTCRTTCDAIRSGEPHVRAVACQ